MSWSVVEGKEDVPNAVCVSDYRSDSETVLPVAVLPILRTSFVGKTLDPNLGSGDRLKR